MLFKHKYNIAAGVFEIFRQGKKILYSDLTKKQDRKNNIIKENMQLNIFPRFGFESKTINARIKS